MRGALKMSDPQYHSSFDATPHTLNSPSLLPPAPILSAMARSRQSAGSRQFSMGANNFNFPSSHLDGCEDPRHWICWLQDSSTTSSPRSEDCYSERVKQIQLKADVGVEGVS